MYATLTLSFGFAKITELYNTAKLNRRDTAYVAGT